MARQYLTGKVTLGIFWVPVNWTQTKTGGASLMIN